jgi:site-specific recombinase XerD
MKNLANKFEKFLRFERGYADFTINSYITDLFQFFDYIDNNEIKNISDVKKNVIRGFLESLY